MRLFDPKFKENMTPYLLQCLLSVAIIFTVLLLIDAISNMTIIASLGASTFIATTMPHVNSSKPRYLIGGYCVGAVCGIAMSYVYGALEAHGVTLLGRSPHIIACAAAVGLAIFLMTACNFEHPPAAALAMGLVLEPRVWFTAGAALLSIVLISLIKRLFMKRLKNLL